MVKILEEQELGILFGEELRDMEEILYAIHSEVRNSI